MTLHRRRLVQSLALAGGSGAIAQGQSPANPIDALRHVSAAHGIDLSDDRLRVVEPILQQRKTQLQAVRNFEIDDTIEPGNGSL